MASETEGQDTPGVESELRLTRASRIISAATGWSVAAGLIPVPILDLAALGAVQVKMISDLGALYGQPLKKEAVRSAVSVLLGVLVPSQIAGGIAVSSPKLVPGMGSVIGAVSFSAFGAAASYAIGKIFVRHFEAGGTIESFQPEFVEEDLKKEFKAARTRSEPKPA